MKIWYLFTESFRCRLIPSSISEQVCNFCVNLAGKTTHPSVCNVYCPRFKRLHCVWTSNCKSHTTLRAKVELETLFEETYNSILSSTYTWIDAAPTTCVYQKRCPNLGFYQRERTAAQLLEMYFISLNKSGCASSI